MSGYLARVALGARSAADARPRWVSPYEGSAAALTTEDRTVDASPGAPPALDAPGGLLTHSDGAANATTRPVDDRAPEVTTRSRAEIRPPERREIVAEPDVPDAVPARPAPRPRIAAPTVAAPPRPAHAEPERPAASRIVPEHQVPAAKLPEPVVQVRGGPAPARERAPASPGEASPTVRARPHPVQAAGQRPAAHLAPRALEPARPRERGRAAAQPAPAAPTVVVTIGRLEVRAAPPPPPRQRSAPSPMSLDTYLARRDQEKR